LASCLSRNAPTISSDEPELQEVGGARWGDHANSPILKRQPDREDRDCIQTIHVKTILSKQVFA
jgi:hypothetical protein